MLNVGTYTFDMKATKHIKTLRKMTAASENPVLLKILQIIAPTLIKMAKLPVRIDNIMDTLLSATTMVYADAPQAKEKFIQLSLKGIPIFYAFSKDDKLIGDKCCYDLAYLLGASDADIYSYDKNGMIMHAEDQKKSFLSCSKKFNISLVSQATFAPEKESVIRTQCADKFLHQQFVANSSLPNAVSKMSLIHDY
ncbi:UNVERIFIED_CONTAM: hypothetical protein NCL1_14832 [Trichonephila clavipes]